MGNHLLILFISRFFMMFVIEQFMRVFFDKRRTSFPVMALSYLALPVGLNAASLFFLLFDGLPVRLSVILIEVVLPVVLFDVIALNYEGSRKKRHVASLSIFAIGIAINYALAIIFGAQIRAFGNLVPRQSDALFMFEMGASLLLGLAAALLLQNLRNIRKITLPAVWVSFLAIPLSSIVVIFIVVFAGGISVHAQVLVICIMFGISVFVFFLLDRISAAGEARLEAAIRARESDGYLAQLRLMQESAEQTAAIRHDMKVHLAAIGGLAAESKPEDVSAYIAGLLGSMDAAKLLSDTGNPVFDSVINYKLRNAERDGVKPELRLRIAPDMNVAPSDAAAILGNLLDNALDAVARVDVDDKKIWLDIEYNNESLFIKVKNAFDGVVKYAQKNGLPVTRKPDGGGHGLRNIQRAVEKYDGLIKIAHNGNVFSVTILLYLDGGLLKTTANHENLGSRKK